MPFRPPRKVGFFSPLNAMSMTIQVIMATAVARLVLTIAAAASAPAKYGSPPLKPFQPSHRMPALTATNMQVVRDGALAVALEPGLDHRRGDEARGARGQVDDVAAGEVQGALARPEPPPHSRNAFTA